MLDHNQKRRIIEIAVIVVLSCVLFLACNHNPLNNDIVISNENSVSEEGNVDGGDDAEKGNNPGTGETASGNETSEKEDSQKEDSQKEVSKKETDEKAKKVCVYVCGAVKNPGLYELPEGSRKMEALKKAGGFAEDACTDYINLADYLSDGEMLRIPFREEVTSYPLSGGGTVSVADSRVNINTASAEELCTVPGIGKSKAEAILKYRSSGGKFETVEDLMKIPGIKQGTFEKLRDYIRVK